MAIEMVLTAIIILILGLWFVYDRKQKKVMMEQLLANAPLQERVKNAENREIELKQSLNEKNESLDALNRKLSDSEIAISRLETQLSGDRKTADEKLAFKEDAKNKLANEFELLANKIFEKKGKALSEQNRSSLDEVLKPMREQLGDFRKRVDEVHVNDAKDRASLREHLGQLEKLNRQMSEDALGLTQALKGESKAQGNWGEMILQKILESSGLREGHEFKREDSTTLDGGRRLRPDVVIYMPGDKQVIIDSKVSLTDYERALSAEDPAAHQKSVKAHVASLKQHIRMLADKRYDQIPGLHSPDYVLMFVPIEGAYMMAIEADQGIFEAAFDKRVAVVTPSTLYATLKLIEQLWRYERQSENVVKLIDRASRLHDKMATFVESFEDIGNRLEQAQKAYDQSLNRIKTGPGNVISQIATLGALAGKTKKELPSHLTEVAALEDKAGDEA
ncbi:MAG: DNA recombination protein RmuC [Mariprofundaceae bacterium]